MSSFSPLASPDQAVPAIRLENDPAVFLSSARLAVLRQRVEAQAEPTYSAYLKLKGAADANLERHPTVPSRWYVPPYYQDKEGHHIAKGSLANDANSAYELALMFWLTGHDEYALAAVRLIKGWIEGLEDLSREHDSPLSFSYHFPAFIFAADLLRHSSFWAAADEAAFRTFLREKALPLNTMNHHNNWGNWGLVLVMGIAAYLGDQALFETGIARWKEFIETQIAEDGHLPHEVTRNGGVGETGLWYSHFSLMPQTLAAEIARVNGVELFEYQSPSGRTLRQAYEILVPWTCDTQTFPYYKGEDPNEQRGTNYISYWEILNVLWPQPQAQSMLAIMRPLSGSHCAPHLTFTHGQ